MKREAAPVLGILGGAAPRSVGELRRGAQWARGAGHKEAAGVPAASSITRSSNRSYFLRAGALPAGFAAGLAAGFAAFFTGISGSLS